MPGYYAEFHEGAISKQVPEDMPPDPFMEAWNIVDAVLGRIPSRFETNAEAAAYYSDPATKAMFGMQTRQQFLIQFAELTLKLMRSAHQAQIHPLPEDIVQLAASCGFMESVKRNSSDPRQQNLLLVRDIHADDHVFVWKD